MRKINLKILFSIFIAFCLGYTGMAQAVQAVNNTTDAFGTENCGTMPAVLQRVATDPAYAAIYNQHQNDLATGIYRSLDPCATPIVIPLAFHFDDSFSCADPDCLTSEVEESIAALNDAFADNTQNQLVQDLNAACPSGYPLAPISTGSCITFCLAEPRTAFSNQGIDAACDPSITIGAFCGGINFCAGGGAPPYYGGILNVFIIGNDGGAGILGVADGIPGAANGDGVTVLGSVFGADGGGCISGGPINTSGLYGGGATLAHEVGHYLGLFHIWADDGGGCVFDDGISDTPQQGDNNQNLFPCPTVSTAAGCTNLPFSCGSYDFYHNYMDYTGDNCLVMFTQEQAQVMNATANALFGSTSAVCDTDPPVLTSLCEQTVCDPDCDFVADITAVCDADGLNYTVTVVITGGTGPFDVNETADNDPSMIDSVLDSGVAAGTYTYSFPAGTNSNVVVVDNGIADCFDGEFIFNPCAACEFEVTFDYDNVTCNDFGGTLLPTIPVIVTNGGGIVWIDQDGNTTFDAADIDITAGGNIGFPTTDLTFTVYDSGAQDCFQTYTVESGNYSCDGVAEGGVPLRVCTFEADADLVDYTCNGDGTATVTLNIDKIAGNLTVLAGGATQVSAMGDSATYEVVVPVGAGCGSTAVTFADDGSDVSTDSGVSITAPSNIANMITNVGYNSFADWGIDISTVSPPVCGTLAQPDDGTAPATDFCEPTPPATPTAAQCAALAGNIAIIDRGVCTFTTKAENAQACGATAVVICNNDTANPDAVITMAGTSVNPVTIPTIFLSYNQCQQLYANLNNGPVDMCIGAPMDVPCERTVNIDACALVCAGIPYCDDPCFVDYNPTPGPDDTPDAAECVTPLDCTNGSSTAQACDDGDACTENDMESVLDCDATVVCVPCAGTPVATCTLPSVAQACDDGDPCTINDMEEVDACDATVVCVPCAGTVDPTSCDPACVTLQACDDGEPCTTGEQESVNADGTVCEPCGLNAMVVSPACGDPNASNYDPDATCIDNALCTFGEYCDNPCFAEYTPDPNPGDTPNSTLCVTPLGCGDNPDAACLTEGDACDDMDCNTENDVATTITETGEVCACAGTPITPPTCDDGCDLTTDTYNTTDCSCTNTEPDPDDGCDLTTDAFDAATCTVTNTPTCAADEIFDAADCMCVTDGVAGCTDPCDPNYDATATVNDPALCAGYDDTCNADCTAGPFGGTWDAATCACINETAPVNGCTNAMADNYDPAANCDDGTCIGPVCEDGIAGSVSAEDLGCSVEGIEVTIYDANGAVVGTATTDANGDYALMGLFPCDSYTAELTGNVPDCYVNSGGITGPIGFDVDGDGTADGANFTENPQIPTLSQWGLISLALLLMIIGSLKMSATRVALQKYSVK